MAEIIEDEERERLSLFSGSRLGSGSKVAGGGPDLRVLLAGAGALLLLLAGFNLLTVFLPTGDDVDLYFRYTRRTFGGELPYRDFGVEYPPLALLFFYLPGLACYPLGGLEVTRYKWLFHTECFLLTLASLGLLYDLLKGSAWNRAGRNGRLVAFVAGAGLISLYLLQRFDIGASFFTLAAVWCLGRKWPGWAGVMLGLGTAAKLYPVVLLPLGLLWLWQGGAAMGGGKKAGAGRKDALRLAVAFAVAGAGAVLPAALVSLDGLGAFLSYHSARGLELEAPFAGLVVFGSYLGLTDALAMVEYGSLGLASPWVRPLASLSTGLTVAGLLLIYGLAWWGLRRPAPRPAGWLVAAFSLAVLWFVLANKVLSPQYMIWLLVLMPLWKSRLNIALFLVALPLSVIPFPFLIDWLSRLDALPFVLLAVRNSLLAVIMVRLGREVFFYKGTDNTDNIERK